MVVVLIGEQPDEEAPMPRQAYIIRQIKRPEEVAAAARSLWPPVYPCSGLRARRNCVRAVSPSWSDDHEAGFWSQNVEAQNLSHTNW